MTAKDKLARTTPNELTRWRIFNQATVALGKAQATGDALRVLVASLNKLGFHVVAGELDPPQEAFTPRLVSFSSEKAIDPAETLPAPPERRPIPLRSLPVSRETIQNKTVELAALTPRQLETLIGPDRPARNALSAAGRDSVPSIVAPIFVAGVANHLLFILADTLAAGDIPSITAFVNLVAAILEKNTLLQRADEQRKNAQTLQEVSRIVGSSLELDVVLGLILEQLAGVIPYDSSAILLETGNSLKLEAGRGFDQAEPVLDIVVPANTNTLYQELKRAQKPIIINDVRADPRYVIWAGASPVRSWIGVPLIWKNNVFGQIAVDSFAENAFAEQDGQLVFAFAQLVAAAIQNAKLFNQTVQTAGELRALLDSAREVTSTLDTARLMHLMARRVKELMQANLVTVYLLQPPGDTLSRLVHLDDDGGRASEEVSRRAAGQAMDRKQGIIINNPGTLAAQGSRRPVAMVLMAVPFIVKDQAIGAITMGRPAEAAFKQADLELLTRFALQTGIAIENSRLYKQVERRLRREGLINDLSRRISSKLSLDSLVADIMQTAQTISDADVAAVVLVDPDDERRILQFARGIPASQVPSVLTTSPGLATRAIETQKVLLTHTDAAETFAGPPWIEGDINEAIAVPLSSGGDPLGAMGLFTVDTPFEHSDEILNTLEAIGRQAGVAIENALLFKRVNEYAQNLAGQVEARTAEIRSQKEQTDAILAAAADAILITAADGAIEYVNPAFTTLTGYLPQEVAGQNPRMFKSGRTPPHVYRQMWHTILKGKVWRGELTNRKKDGSFYNVDLTIAPIFNNRGQIDKFVAIERDISKLRQLDRLKTEFLGTAAHELRGPLTTIRGYAELLLSRTDFSAQESQKFIGYIHEQAVHLAALVSDLLDVSKIEAGAAFVINPKMVNPRPIFERTAAHWQTRTTAHQIQLVAPQTIPDVAVDQDRLEQTLNNLLSNAVKYSPQGGDITLTVAVSPANLRVSVTDQGIGMTLEQQKHVFEKFWRADASSTAVEGTGLGMVIVKYIVESHGGKIWLSSRQGAGTTVSFTLPLTTGLATVLIIEDESSILEVEEHLLNMEGYRVITAKTGDRGLEMALQEHPDLIVLDLMLPKLKGEDVLRRLKAIPATQYIPVVVVSAKSGLAQIENAFTL
ncbi:MAG: GAF domain-containing protein, partial [Anaerolineae bacterium]